MSKDCCTSLTLILVKVKKIKLSTRYDVLWLLMSYFNWRTFTVREDEYISLNYSYRMIFIVSTFIGKQNAFGHLQTLTNSNRFSYGIYT